MLDSSLFNCTSLNTENITNRYAKKLSQDSIESGCTYRNFLNAFLSGEVLMHSLNNLKSFVLSVKNSNG